MNSSKIVIGDDCINKIKDIPYEDFINISGNPLEKLPLSIVLNDYISCEDYDKYCSNTTDTYKDFYRLFLFH